MLNRCMPAWARSPRAALALGLAPAAASAGAKPWLDPALLAAAQKEGPLIVYSSTNEQEGLPLFKIFTEATGIKVNYVRAADTPLMGRIAIEFRTKQKAWDILQTTTINKVPPPMLAQIDPPEAKHISPDARDPGRRWYGVYANYNAPAYNTKLVKPRRTAEDLRGVRSAQEQWAGRVAIDGTDNEWLKAMFEYYGEQKATQLDQGHRGDAQADHHRRPSCAGARDRRRRIRDLAQQLRQPVDKREARRRRRSRSWRWIRWRCCSGRSACSAMAPNPNAARLAANFMLSQEAQQFIAKFGRLADAQRRGGQSARHRRDDQAEEGHSGAADAGGGEGLAAQVPGTVQAALRDRVSRTREQRCTADPDPVAWK